MNAPESPGSSGMMTDTQAGKSIPVSSGEGYVDRCWRCGWTKGPHIWTSRGVQCSRADDCDTRYEAQREAKRKGQT